MQTIQKRQLLILAAIPSILVAACGEKPHTMVEFMHDVDLMKKTRAACQVSPAESDKKPNCLNAEYAKQMMWDSELRVCYKDSIPDHACIDEGMAKRSNK